MRRLVDCIHLLWMSGVVREGGIDRLVKNGLEAKLNQVTLLDGKQLMTFIITKFQAQKKPLVSDFYFHTIWCEGRTHGLRIIC